MAMFRGGTEHLGLRKVGVGGGREGEVTEGGRGGEVRAGHGKVSAN